MIEVKIRTSGEKFYSITDEIKKAAPKLTQSNSGVLYMFLQHTSCALTISESFDPTAKRDLEVFMDHLAPRNLHFISHTAEGEDDSPSHMKSVLLQNHLALPVEKGEIVLGTWQGIYLAEFRDQPNTRKILLKFIKE